MEKAEKKEKKLPEGITAEMYEAAVEKYGAKNVKCCTIPLEDDGDLDEYEKELKSISATTEKKELNVLVKIPNREIISLMRKYMKDSPNKADEILVKGCLLSHAEQVLNNDALFFAVLKCCADLIPVSEGRIKNL